MSKVNKNKLCFGNVVNTSKAYMIVTMVGKATHYNTRGPCVLCV